MEQLSIPSSNSQIKNKIKLNWAPMSNLLVQYKPLTISETNITNQVNTELKEIRIRRVLEKQVSP